jgi:hypothetical protein
LKKLDVAHHPDAMCSTNLSHIFGLKSRVTGTKRIYFTGDGRLQDKVIVRIADHGRKTLRQIGKRAAFAQKRRVPFNGFGGSRPMRLNPRVSHHAPHFRKPALAILRGEHWRGAEAVFLELSTRLARRGPW